MGLTPQQRTVLMTWRAQQDARRRLQAAQRHPLSLPILYGICGLCAGVVLALLVIGFVHGGLP